MEPVLGIAHVTKTFRVPSVPAQSLREASRLLGQSRRSARILRALDDVTFDVRPGEFLGIIGRNGSGKSTLLKVLAGIYRPTTGTVAARGQISAFLELGVGFNPELTARENVFLNAAVLGLPRATARARYDDVVTFAGLGPFMEARLKTFSAGMQVRLAFSLALHVPSDLLLLDEVLAVGDLEFQERCARVFADLKRSGRTILLVSHDLESIRGFCDRALLLEEGRILGDGRPDDVIARYHHLVGERAGHAPPPGTVRRWGDERAAITAARLRNAAGEATTQLQHGESLTVSVDVRFRATTARPVFGITLRDARGRRVFVTNTAWRGMDTGVFSAGERVTVDWTVTNYLSAGTYTLSPAVAASDLHTMHDSWEDALTVRVDAPVETGGIADLPHDVRILRPPAVEPIARARLGTRDAAENARA